MREDVLVVTSWDRHGAAKYGHRWLETFQQHWGEQEFYIIGEDDLYREPWVDACLREFEKDPETKNTNDIHKGCAKWAKKVFAISLVIEDQVSDWLLWIDGDVEFLAPPTDEFFATVCDDAWDVSYLGRPWAYASETGFVAYNMKSARTRMLLAMMRDTYLTGYFRELDEWGDAGVFDHCKSLIPGLMDKNLCMHLLDKVDTVEQGGMHVWPHTVLAQFMRHNKGARRRKAAYG